MSWWDAIVNTAKVVKNTVQKAASLVPQPDLSSVVAGAGQFQRPIYARPVNNIGGIVAEAWQNENGEGSSQGIRVRVTTRARITYELDRFQKNALLMFVQIQNQQNEGRNKDSTNQVVSQLVETFTSFRFEVDIHTDLTRSQVEQKCAEFFQRDFSLYGAVVVIILSHDGARGELSALDARFSESVVLRHLTDDLTPTLLDKPKIYITEANRTGEPTLGHYSIPIEEHHQDILGLHIPRVSTESNGNLSPILQLCNDMREVGDSRDFASIVQKVVEAAQSMPVFSNLPIELINRLSKDMILAKT